MKMQSYSLVHVSDICLPPALLSNGGTLSTRVEHTPLSIRERTPGALQSCHSLQPRDIKWRCHKPCKNFLFPSLLSLSLELNLGLCARQAKSTELHSAWQPFHVLMMITVKHLGGSVNSIFDTWSVSFKPKILFFLAVFYLWQKAVFHLSTLNVFSKLIKVWTMSPELGRWLGG